ncbi:MAG: YlmC/YmxH family sporulation protein [Oscillospiraceae bacterium]|nr:YlmC/YmxH family sporulation protein [Oscillospiraceae bacterium]
MVCRMQDLRYKEVINVRDGSCLGSVCDVEIDTVTAMVVSLVIYGRARLFGLFLREEDIIIHWCDIEVIGEDTILVNMRPELRDHRPARRGGIFSGLFG